MDSGEDEGIIHLGTFTEKNVSNVSAWLHGKLQDDRSFFPSREIHLLVHDSDIYVRGLPERHIESFREQVERWATIDQEPFVAAVAQYSAMLGVVARLLPERERSGWIEENQAYLADIGGRWDRYWWMIRQFLAMPRYAYTVRTDSKKESA